MTMAVGGRLFKNIFSICPNIIIAQTNLYGYTTNLCENINLFSHYHYTRIIITTLLIDKKYISSRKQDQFQSFSNPGACKIQIFNFVTNFRHRVQTFKTSVSYSDFILFQKLSNKPVDIFECFTIKNITIISYCLKLSL